MKRKFLQFLSLSILVCVPFIGGAQVNSQGSIIIDPYYGYPNFGKSFASSLSSSSSDIKIGGIGPAGIRAEYMLADKFGMGIDFIYNSLTTSYFEDSIGVDGKITQSYEAKYAMQRFRVQLRMNYHFIENDNIDAYVGFGAGTNIRRYSFTSDKPGSSSPAESGSLIPVSMRFALGMRYYFTENIGFNTELGLGGPMISAGLSLRF
jgi:opacity protein-like surface antigen